MDTDAVVFLRDMREQFGVGMTIEEPKVAQKKYERVLDPAHGGDTALDGVIAMLKSKVRDWMGNASNESLVVTVERYSRKRSNEQNARLWKMLGLLEVNGVKCQDSGKTMTAEGWHDYLRVKHGYIYGTRAVAVPNGAGGWFMVEAPNPQPTRKGADGQMTVEQHSEYMDRVADELTEAGIDFDELGKAA